MNGHPLIVGEERRRLGFVQECISDPLLTTSTYLSIERRNKEFILCVNIPVCVHYRHFEGGPFSCDLGECLQQTPVP